MSIGRFNEAHWQLICQVVEQKIISADENTRTKWLRNQLLLHLGFNLGLRLHELANAKLTDLYTVQRQGQTQHWLTVIGKGQKQRQVPIPLTTYLLLVETYLKLTGRSIHRLGLEYPLIPPLRGSDKQPLTPLAIHKALKECFAYVAEVLADTHPDVAQKLDQASAHWLRHSHGSAAAERNIPLAMIRDNLGHSSIATTSCYLHTDQDARHEAFANGFAGTIKPV
ncbi:tyrosine-type recombinase/integrase [Methylocucumis oryzae]|uniref:tyrosine-type recombinase/integrase n=1 Tax=Methylocucumis oryzae TaxID=1632867 RepID=UPI0006971F82|nr:site-specific integrase [Methylocucumis oryzae]